jgi:hypothetical protein
MVLQRMLNIIKSKGKKTEFQWLQNPCEINRDNLNNMILEASKDFRKERGNI